jgi:hypothetical protein
MNKIRSQSSPHYHQLTQNFKMINLTNTIVELVLRHFHRHCYKSSPLWFLVGEDLSCSGSSYGWTWWTQRFTWFRPPERNILRSRRGVCCITMLAQIWVELAQNSLRNLTSTQPFIAQGCDSYIATQGLAGGPEVVWSLRYTSLLARSRKGCLQWRGECPVLSSRHVAVTPHP